jgi:hypothetical protein
MNQDTTTTTATPDMPTLAGQMAQATQSLADALKNLDGQFASLHAKIDRIVAAVDDGDLQASAKHDQDLRNKLAELETTNRNLKAQSDAARRKTLSPMVSALLAKEGVEGDALIDKPVIEKALAGLSIEQRIAVKSELARAGILV